MNVTISRLELCSHNILEVAAGSNCPCKDEKRSGRTYFQITNLGCTDLRIRFLVEPHLQEDQKWLSVNKLEILLLGSSERDTFVAALEHALDVLKPYGLVREVGCRKLGKATIKVP